MDNPRRKASLHAPDHDRKPPPVTRTHRPLAAALWMAGSIAGFSLVAVAGRALSRDLDTFEIMLYRSLIGVLIVTAAAFLTGRTAALAPTRLGTHLVRNLFHFAGQNLWLYALTLIPLAQLFALEFSYPILVALAAPFLLGERLTSHRILAAVTGFAGILIVARPFGTEAMSLGLLAAILCAVGFAGAAIVTKRLTAHVSVLAILFWLTVMQSAFGLAGAGFDGTIALPHRDLAPWLALIGTGGLGAHFCLTRALSLAPASFVTPIDFLRLPVIGLVGMLAYGEALDPYVFLGGAVILGANLVNIRGEARKKPQSMT